MVGVAGNNAFSSALDGVFEDILTVIDDVGGLSVAVFLPPSDEFWINL